MTPVTSVIFSQTSEAQQACFAQALLSDDKSTHVGTQYQRVPKSKYLNVVLGLPNYMYTTQIDEIKQSIWGERNVVPPFPHCTLRQFLVKAVKKQMLNITFPCHIS